MRTLALLLAASGLAWLTWKRETLSHAPPIGTADGVAFVPWPSGGELPAPSGADLPLPMNAPRGIRNNNPGNIRKTADRWQGMSNNQADPDFVVFDAPVYGLRALARVLLAYQGRYGLDTVREIIARWAPPGENNTDAYVADVAARIGQRADDVMDLRARPALLEQLVAAIVEHENGAQPYDATTIAQAVGLALA